MKQSLLTIFLLWLCAPLAFAQGPNKGAIEAFAARTGALPTIDKATNSLGFLRFPTERAFQINGGDAAQKSMNFVSENKALFGLRANQDEYRLRKQESDAYGLENITLQQTYKGVPVYDGLMKFHYNKGQALTSLNGNYISDIKVNVSPTLAQHEAESAAVRHVMSQNFQAPENVKANKSTLCIFQKGLVQGYNGAKLLVYQVEVRNDTGIREFVFVDAHNGRIVEQFTGTHHALDRKLYENSTANLIWSEGNAFPGSLDIWQQSEVQTSGFIYNLMKNAFGRVSYNGADATMITINNKTGINCPNANWDGVSANYCTNIATDDVVAHEWGHAYTEYTSDLVYAWQPGALNESYSDIWGETVDMLNGYMDQGESNAARTACGSSDRWIVGEKITAGPGLTRDMWNPNCSNQPGKVSDQQYWCIAADNGGVHINSGILNHAYALLVDGGTFNGQTITGIGLIKAAHIFWRAQSQFMTSTTDFSAQADILEASAAGLVGVNLKGLSTGGIDPGLSGQVINNNDLLQLAKTIAAVEMRENSSCQFATVLKPAPALCEGANQGLAIFFENFESGLGGFTTSSVPGDVADWFVRSWQQVTGPAGRPGKVAYGVDYTGGNCATDMENGLIRMESPVIAIPVGTAGNLNMAFDHYVAIEDTWDGGNIKYRINGGAWKFLPDSVFTANPYNNFINAAVAGNNNPLASEPAFTGSDQGTVLGTWGQSQVNLSKLGLVAGNTIQFRFELGTDGCGGLDGWYIDDFRLYSCAVTPAVHFAATSASINEGAATTPGAGCLDYIDKTVTVQIDKAPSQPVTVTFNTPAGTAKQGADYTITPASVTLSAGSLTQHVTLRIFNDAYVEGEETIDLSYNVNANGGNGFAATGFQNFQFTILDDDFAPGNYTDTLLSSNFNNGAQGWSVINGGNSFHSWEIAQYTNAGLDAVKSPFFFVNSDIQDGNLFDFNEYLESPPVNSSGKKNLVLTFSQDWRPYIDANNEQGIVEVWDGSAWQTLLTQNQATGRKGNIGTYTPDIVNLPIPNAYANPNMKVRFHYVGHWEYWWAIDDVKITASNSTQVMSAVNTGNAAQEYLGPNETAVFYDPSTGNLMAKIKNLSAHDYGCTTVEVDRSGANGAPWLGSHQVSNKTFKVTPTNNNPTGQYEITLYYKGSELTIFTPANIRSMGKSVGSIATSEASTSTTVAVVSAPAFTGDYSFTATFSTGFSGFGLSSAPPGSALPVTLVNFEGRNTSEGNLLQWTTSSESNNDYFAIEESTNGKTFFETGRVKGVGNTSVTNRYNFTDMDFNKGITYYRLKQVDFDGKYAYSRIVAIDAPAAGNIRFYPNPVQSAMNIELPNLQGNWVNARVINASGQEVIVREKAIVQNGKLNLQLGRLPAGIYQVLITNDKVNYRLSVFKP